MSNGQRARRGDGDRRPPRSRRTPAPSGAPDHRRAHTPIRTPASIPHPLLSSLLGAVSRSVAGSVGPPAPIVALVAICGTDAASRSRPATVIARASPWPRVQWLPLSGRDRHGRGWRRRDRDSAFRAKRSSREAFDRSALPMHRAQNCRDVAGCRISGEPAYSSESPPSFRDEQAAHSPLFGQSGAISRETASMTASLLVVRSGAVVALNSGFSVAQALAIDWTRTRIAVASHRSVNLPSL